jgi:hypothetical protein
MTKFIAFIYMAVLILCIAAVGVLFTTCVETESCEETCQRVHEGKVDCKPVCNFKASATR